MTGYEFTLAMVDTLRWPVVFTVLIIVAYGWYR